LVTPTLGAATATTINGVTIPSATDTTMLLAKTSQAFAGGVNLTSGAIATGSVTVACGLGPSQYIINGGAFTITAPANDGECRVFMRNNGSAGAVTFSGFTVGSNTGAALDTTSGHLFTIFIWRVTDGTGSTAGYSIYAHQ
jgi:hypothetical protein